MMPISADCRAFGEQGQTDLCESQFSFDGRRMRNHSGETV